MRLAVIPARGGSKRIPRKNIKPFCGKPMIAWSIEAALQSGCFDEVIVSTDDTEIADIARQWGAEVPFLRPSELADDHTGTLPVVAHAIRWHADRGLSPEHVCCIYPTAPLLLPKFLAHAYELMMQTGCPFCLGVANFGHPIQRALRMSPIGQLSMFFAEYAKTRSQDLEPAYHDAGQFCWATAAAFIEGRFPLLANSAAIVLPRSRVGDIDTADDWELAEALHGALAAMSGT